MRHRWRQLRAHLLQGDSPGWVGPLGSRPDTPDMLDSWLSAATAAAAYRERYELADHTDLIGPRPSVSRPDAQAAYDHARLHIDRHLARTLHHLDDSELDGLARTQQHIHNTMPSFDGSSSLSGVMRG